jgi:DNA mismatch repair protein MutL
MSTIKLLSNDLINKIAAGEVVERPASALKELIENSIDALATEITVRLEESGLKKIDVIDNGIGMDKEDSILAFKQHATSKIKSEKDLSAIYTLGFRGEALASISSISDVTIHTFNGQDTPSFTYNNSDKIISEPGQGRAKGTTVSINNIFNKVPARRKFLRSPNTEYKYILDTFIFIALSHKNISFKLIKDDKIIYDLKATNTLTTRISELFPSIKETQIIPINYDSPNIKISGFIGHPSISRQDNTQQFVFVNNRYIRDNVINKAIKDAYTSILLQHHQPIFFVFIEINPENIDVNIHPRKLEVKFDDTHLIFSAIKQSTQKALQMTIKDNFVSQTQSYTTIKSANQDSPKFTSNKEYNDFSFSQTRPTVKQSINFTQQLFNNILDTTDQQINTEQITPSQFFNTYIVFQKAESLLVVDQHAADERVNFEKILDRVNNNEVLESLDLLIPITTQLTKQEIDATRQYKSIIESYGFSISIEATKAKIERVPLLLKGNFTENTFKELLNDLLQSEGKESQALEKHKEAIVATIACHSSIRAGQRLSTVEMTQLITNLYKCRLPYSCPHGRPIIWELNRYDIEKNFKRKL